MGEIRWIPIHGIFDIPVPSPFISGNYMEGKHKNKTFKKALVALVVALRCMFSELLEHKSIKE